MNDLEVFENQQFGEIRAVSIENEPWFVASDVCKALDLTNATVVVQRLDEDERSKFNLGRQGETNIVNEYGLYSLVLSSRKPEAKAFKRWITHDVVPTIRKHGAYATPDTIDKIMWIILVVVFLVLFVVSLLAILPIGLTSIEAVLMAIIYVFLLVFMFDDEVKNKML